MTTLNLVITQGTDDAWQYTTAGVVNYAGQYSVIGGYSGQGTHTGWRFTGASGVGGSTITAATLSFRAASTLSAAFICNLYAQKVAAPVTFTATPFDITNATPLTTQSAPFGSAELGSWVSGSWYSYTHASLVLLLQELATAYPALTDIKLISWYASGTGYRLPQTYEAAAVGTKSAKLDINYTASLPQTVTPAALVADPAWPGWTVVPGGVAQVAAALHTAVGFPALVPNHRQNPSAFHAAPAFPAPTVTPGVVRVTPTALHVAPVFPTATPQGQTVTLTPAALSVAPDFGPPSVSSDEFVSPTALHIHPVLPSTTVVAELRPALDGRLAPTPKFPAPAVTAGAVTVSALALHGRPAFLAPTVMPGTATIAVVTLHVQTAFPIATSGKVVAVATLHVQSAFPGGAIGTSDKVYPSALKGTPAFPVPTVINRQIVIAQSMSVRPRFPSVYLVATITAATFHVHPAFPASSVHAGLVVVTATTLSVDTTFPVSQAAGSARLVLVAFSRAPYFPEPVVIGAGVTIKWDYLGNAPWYIDPATYPAGVQFQLVAWIATSSVLVSVYARLYDVDHGVAVIGSEVAGLLPPPAIGAVIMPSIGPLFSLPIAAHYAVQFGGQVGGSFTGYGSALEWRT